MIGSKVAFLIFVLSWAADLARGTGHITPLSNRIYKNSTACIAENLRMTDRYICDAEGNIICIGGWSDPSKLCSEPVCNIHGQTCVNGECIMPNVCGCQVGWDGPLCDECIPLGGCKHGSCEKPMECNCQAGWTGGQCDKPECSGCVNGCCHEPNTCICDFGWKGPNCTECSTLPNCKNGQCHTHPFQCVCNEGWEGLGCSKPICRQSCHTTNGYCRLPGECLCRNGWTGRDCFECVPYPGCKGNCVNNVPWTCSDTDKTGLGNADKWSEWTSWSECSKTCGEGTQKRQRTCAKVGTSPGNCVGKSVDFRECTKKLCAVDGNWAKWSKWSSCSRTCGSGIRSRHRVCSNPMPKYGGKQCPGTNTETVTCHYRGCPTPGRWSSWQQWAVCSASCGEGQKQRVRHCDSPPPTNGGETCFGEAGDTMNCFVKHCPIDGVWQTWSSWTVCSKTCGEGQRERSRICSEPLFGGRPCPGGSSLEREVVGCFINQVCAVDGNWSTWTLWGTCSTTCGSGDRQRRRSCNNPPAKYGGNPCLGNGLDTEPCQNTQECPRDGRWAGWNSWTTCTATCNGGNQTRNRNCIEPQNGGQACQGLASETRQCGQAKCPQDGVWTNWAQWSTCSLTCEGGRRTRNRTCTPPQNGGAQCIGSARQEDSCNSGVICNRVPVWSSWRNWGICSSSCGGGNRVRNRICTTASQGIPCPGNDSETGPCNNGVCAGMWSQWAQWSTCSTTCGEGSKTRQRTCPTLSKGQPCEGSAFQQAPCNLGQCGGDGNWGQWREWGQCSATCGHGHRMRQRHCNNPPPSAGGRHCHGSAWDKDPCYAGGDCSTDGNWGQWRPWSQCSVTCGNGTNTRSRSCDSPPPTQGGSYCFGNGQENGVCTTHSYCGVDGGFSEWTQWSPCTADCIEDRGDRVRRRFCNNPPPSYGGAQCHGEIKQKEYCTGHIHKQTTDPTSKCYHIGQ